MKKKIAILHIATGRYTVFWKDFYESFQEYFLSGHDRTFFLFTDDKQIETAENVVKIQQENLGWPYITLLRFDFFLGIENQLKEYDYIFFFNANMMPVVPIGEEVLPEERQELTVALHPTICFWPHHAWTYETNPDSTACIPAGQGDYYVMGSFIGGTREGFLRMCHVLSENIQDDLKRDVIALWHDESHLNHYILDKNPLVLPPDYITMEGSPAPFDAKVVYLEKGMPRYGGRDYMRGLTDAPATPPRAHPRSLRGYIHRMYFKKRHAREWFRRIFIHKETPRIVELDEELGTQMFQYAFACALRDQGKSVIFDQCGRFISPIPWGGGEIRSLSAENGS